VLPFISSITAGASGAKRVAPPGANDTVVVKTPLLDPAPWRGGGGGGGRG
jgi:hypothetical protein